MALTFLGKDVLLLEDTKPLTKEVEEEAIAKDRMESRRMAFLGMELDLALCESALGLFLVLLLLLVILLLCLLF